MIGVGGEDPRSYIGPWGLSEDIDKSKEEKIVVRYSQLKSRKQGTNKKLSEEEFLLKYDEYSSQYVLQQLA